MATNGTKRKGKLHRTVSVYGSYTFKDKDPVIDEMRTLVADTHGDVSWRTLKQIEDDGGPSTSCMANWFFKETKRPTNAAVEAAGRAMGKRRKWVNM